MYNIFLGIFCVQSTLKAKAFYINGENDTEHVYTQSENLSTEGHLVVTLAAEKQRSAVVQELITFEVHCKYLEQRNR